MVPCETENYLYSKGHCHFDKVAASRIGIEFYQLYIQ